MSSITKFGGKKIVAVINVACLLTLFIVSSALTTRNATAVSYSPTAFYDFAGVSTDSNNNSTLTMSPSCADVGNPNPCNVTSSYGTDADGTYWTWTAKPSGTRGGGFIIDTNSTVGTTFSVALKISFKETDCYRTVIDFTDGASDDHLYFCNGLQFYPKSASTMTFTPNTVYDILLTHLANGTILAYVLDANNVAVKILELQDNPTSQRSLMVPAETTSGGSRFRFFHDECCEYTTEGKVYDVRIWANQALPPEQFGSANAATTTTTTTTITTTTTTTTTTTPPTTTTVLSAQTTAPPALDIEVVAPSGATATTAPVGQSRIATITSVPKSSVSTTVPVATTTTTVVPIKPSGTEKLKPPSAPDVEAGDAAATVGDQTEKAVVERANNQLVVSVGPLKAVVGGVRADGSQMSLDDAGNVHLNSGDTVRIKLSGFEPGSVMEAWLLSTPVLLGTTKVGADGTVTGTFRIPKDASSGSHRVVIVAKTRDGKPATLAVGINVGEWDSGPSVAVWLIALPIVLAIGGALVLPATRRRRRAAEA